MANFFHVGEVWEVCKTKDKKIGHLLIDPVTSAVSISLLHVELCSCLSGLSSEGW